MGERPRPMESELPDLFRRHTIETADERALLLFHLPRLAESIPRGVGVFERDLRPETRGRFDVIRLALGAAFSRMKEPRLQIAPERFLIVEGARAKAAPEG